MFRNFHFIPRGQMKVEKRRFYFSVKFVSCTSSTFSGVDNCYFRIWLGMSCRCAVRIYNFHFASWGHMRIEQWRFLSYKACHLNSIYISNGRQMILQDIVGYILKMCNTLFEFLFSSLESNKGREMMGSSSESCNSISMYYSRYCKQMIC